MCLNLFHVFVCVCVCVYGCVGDVKGLVGLTVGELYLFQVYYCNFIISYFHNFIIHELLLILHFIFHSLSASDHMGNINDHMGNIYFFNDLELVPILNVQQIRKQIDLDDSTRFLHHFVYDDEFTDDNNYTHYWIMKKWEQKKDLHNCLSCILKCDTTEWTIRKCCEEVGKLHPHFEMKPHRFEKNHYWIRKKRDYEIEQVKNKSTD